MSGNGKIYVLLACAASLSVWAATAMANDEPLHDALLHSRVWTNSAGQEYIPTNNLAYWYAPAAVTGAWADALKAVYANGELSAEDVCRGIEDSNPTNRMHLLFRMSALASKGGASNRLHINEKCFSQLMSIAVNDSEVFIRLAAIEVLFSYGGTSNVPRLMSVLQEYNSKTLSRDNRKVYTFICDKLCALGRKEGVDHLLTLLDLGPPGQDILVRGQLGAITGAEVFKKRGYFIGFTNVPLVGRAYIRDLTAWQSRVNEAHAWWATNRASFVFPSQMRIKREN